MAYGHASSKMLDTNLANRKITLEKDFKKKIALSFITGGAFGNILDRINDGKVTDFLHLKVMDFSFFVFNLADLFITIGAILIIYFEIIYRIKDD